MSSNNKHLNFEIPTLPLLTIHMDNESPRGIDAIFQREAMIAAFNNSYINRKSMSLKRSAELYDPKAALVAVKKLIGEELFPCGGFNVLENVSSHQLLIMRYSNDANKSPVFNHCADDMDKTNYVEFMLGFRYDTGSNHFYINATGYPEHIELVNEKITGVLELKEARSYDIDTVKAIDDKGDFSCKKLVIPFEKLDVPHIDFYPGLKKLGFTSIDEFEHAYMSSNKPLLILCGKPGTAKTTLMGYLAMRAAHKNRWIIQQDAPLVSHGFGAWISSVGTDSLIAIEDSDSQIMMERSRDNKQMSAILNFCDGIGSYNNKLMITTNLDSLRTVDKALLRVGRLWKAIEFDLLTPDEANLARAAIGLPDYEFNHDVSLAEAISPEDIDNIHGISAANHPTGFAPAGR